MRLSPTVCLAAICCAAALDDARQARDAQDRVRLESLATAAAASAGHRPQDARIQYECALIHSHWAEVLSELRDRDGARKAAERGIAAAEKAVALNPDSAEYRRVLGTLYGQAIPGNLGLAVRYGRKSMAELDRAAALDPKSSDVYLSRGIGKYYLPAIFGGGPEPAIAELRKAIDLNPNSDQAHLWLGIALRRAGRNREARQALTRAAQLNPNRVWIRQQLDKTPAQ